MVSERCPRCGSDVDRAVVDVIKSWDVPAVVALLRGERDVLRCTAGCPTASPARMFFEDSVDRILVVSHNLLDDIPTLERLAPHFSGRVGVGLTEDHFKSLVRHVYLERLRPIIDLLNHAGVLEFDKKWRELSAARLIALKIAMFDVLPPVYFPADHGFDVEGYFAELQVQVWVRLADEWARPGLRVPRYFEEDLQRFVDHAAPIGNALERFSVLMDEVTENLKGTVKIDGKDVNFYRDMRSRYSGRAIQASLYRDANLANPGAHEWADAYLEHELTRSRWGRRRYARRTRMTMPRARSTISAEALGKSVEVVRNGLLNPSTRPGRRLWDKTMHRMHEAALRAGHERLVDQLFASTGFMSPDADMLTLITKGLEKADPSIIQWVISHPMRYWSIAYDADPEQLDVLEDFLSDRLGPWATANAMASLHRLARFPQRWLRRLKGLTFEDAVQRSELSDWWATALTMAGRHDEALREIADHDTWFPPEHPLPHKHRFTSAIALRESGRVDQALDILEELWAKLRPSLLPAVAVELAPAYFALGRVDLATARLRTALEHCMSFASMEGPLVKAQLQYVLLRNGDEPEEDLWQEQLLGGAMRPRGAGVGGEASFVPADRLTQLYLALAHLEMRRRQAPIRQTAVFDHLPEIVEVAAARGDSFLHLQALRALALHDENADRWTTLISVAEDRYGVDPPVESFVRLALGAGASEAMVRADRLVTRMVSKLSDFERAAGVEVVRAADLEQAREKLVTAGGSADFSLLRTLDELWRDPLRRMGSAPDVIANETTLNRFCARTGLSRTAVIEQAAGNLLLTTISAGQVPQTTVLMPLENVAPLVSRLTARIANWTMSRPGSPLDMPAWRSFTSSLREALMARLEPDDHVVVIESADLHRLPLHLAIAPLWTFSYAPSWGSLLSRPDAAPHTAPVVGAVCAPRFDESPPVERALLASFTRCCDEAREAGLTCTSVVDVDADSSAVTAVLEKSNVCTLLCHGLVDAHSSSVALLLAADGKRPPGNSVAAGTASGVRHRFDWRAGARLTSAPQVIFSAACSSGLSHTLGGQQVGLFSALRSHGLRTLIAPRWDVFAEQVLPVLDRCRTSILTGTAPAVALRLACLEAEQAGVPDWMAWSLTLEGDW